MAEPQQEEPLGPISLPADGGLSVDFVHNVRVRLNAASRAGVDALRVFLPQAVCCALLARCEGLAKTEPTLLEVTAKQQHP